MVLSFKYTPVKHPDGTVSQVPLIPITLSGREKVFTHGLLDSGSDMCCISKSTATVLGLPYTKQQEMAFGIGGKVESVQAEMIVALGRGSEQYTFPVPVKVILNDEEMPVILGQDGFFDQFIITFNKKQSTFFLTKI